MTVTAEPIRNVSTAAYTDLHRGIKRLRTRYIVHHQRAKRPLEVHLIAGETTLKRFTPGEHVETVYPRKQR